MNDFSNSQLTPEQMNTIIGGEKLLDAEGDLVIE